FPVGRRMESLLLRLLAMRLQRRVSNGALAPFGSVHLPLRRLALCLDCDECFELGYESCPACGSGTWSAVARFLDLVADPAPRRAGANKLTPRRGVAAAPADKYLFIVARHQRELFEDLKRAFAKHEGVEVLLDRRVADRRRRQTDTPVLERRRSEQRRRAVDEQLQSFRWALRAV